MGILGLQSGAFTGLRIIQGKGKKRRAADRGITHAKSAYGLFTWSYTTTLFARFAHPELLVAGLDPFLSHAVMSYLVDSVAQGETYDEDSFSENALPHMVCAFRRMRSSAAAVLMPRLGSRPVLQLVYPDHRNRLPWDTSYDSTWREAQPLFTAGQPLGMVETRFLQGAMDRAKLADRRQPSGRPRLIVETLR